jgi:hypothetical protein
MVLTASFTELGIKMALLRFRIGGDAVLSGVAVSAYPRLVPKSKDFVDRGMRHDVREE